MSRLDLTLTAPFALDDIVVRVTLEGGEEIPRVVQAGRLVGDFPARPIAIRLSNEPAADRTLIMNVSDVGDDLHLPRHLCA